MFFFHIKSPPPPEYATERKGTFLFLNSAHGVEPGEDEHEAEAEQQHVELLHLTHLHHASAAQASFKITAKFVVLSKYFNR